VWQVLDSAAARGTFCQCRDNDGVVSRLGDFFRAARCLSSSDQPCRLRVPLLLSSHSSAVVPVYTPHLLDGTTVDPFLTLRAGEKFFLEI